MAGLHLPKLTGFFADGGVVKEMLRLLNHEGSYQRYLEHQKRYHPGAEVLCFDDFFREEMERRWSGGVKRCC